jgi:hypothetical protein
MRRLLLLLPVCLCLAPNRTPGDLRPETVTTARVEFTGDKPLPTDAEFDAMCANNDALGVLEASIRRYREQYTGYTSVLHKQERVGETLREPEVCEVAFREKPFSVYMKWRVGADQAKASLYVAGENNDKILINPNYRIAALVRLNSVARDPEGADARSASRYSVREFGIQKGSERTYVVWKKVAEEGRLWTDYRGLQSIPELGGRKCHVIHRHIDPPEEQGLTDLTLYFDAENWLQTGSVLRRPGGELIAYYFFRDLVLNPAFSADQFQPSRLR